METAVIDWWWNRYQSSAQKTLRLLRFCVVPWKDPSTSGIQWSLEEKDWRDQIREKLQRLWRYQWRADWIRVEHLPRFTTLHLCGKVTDLPSSLGEEPETFTGRILFMSMFNDISCDRKGNQEECVANSKVVSILAKKFGIGQWSFIGPGSEKELVFYWSK